VEVGRPLDGLAGADARTGHGGRSVSTASGAVFEAEGPDFAEAYLVALAEASGIGQIASFDRSLDGVHSVTRVEP
jgi:predicted nucleic acid-binding protein